jgi:hypothetical protein
MLALERPSEQIRAYFFPWNSKRGADYDPQVMSGRAGLPDPSVAHAMWHTFTRYVLPRIVPGAIIALVVDMFVAVVMFTALCGTAVGLVAAFYNAPLVTAVPWGQGALQYALAALVIVNLLLLLISATKSVIRTIVNI